MGVVCKIIPSNGIYKAGQAVTGVVKYIVDEHTDCKNIILTLVGKTHCKFQNIAYNNKLYLTGNEEFLIRHIKILDIKPEDHLEVGSYEYPFTFILPENIPSSYKYRAGILSPYNHICGVNYQLRLTVGKMSCFSLSQTFKTDIVVYGDINVTELDERIYELEKVLFRPLSNKNNIVKLKAEIVKTVVKRGEAVELKLLIFNDTNCIVNIKMRLVRKITLTATCGSKGRFMKEIDSSTCKAPSVPANSSREVSGIIPTLPELYTVLHSRIVLVEYVIKVTIVLPLPHKNVSVEIPVVIS